MAVSTSVTWKGEKCSWGTGEISNPISNSIVVSASLTTSAMTEPLEDENGCRIGLALYDEQYSGTVTVVCKEGASDPTIGNEVTFGKSKSKAYITGFRTDWQNKGKKQLTLTVEGGKNIK